MICERTYLPLHRYDQLTMGFLPLFECFVAVQWCPARRTMDLRVVFIYCSLGQCYLQHVLAASIISPPPHSLNGFPIRAPRRQPVRSACMRYTSYWHYWHDGGDLSTPLFRTSCCSPALLYYIYLFMLQFP